MILNKKVLVVLFGLLLSACASNKPVGMAYAVGDPILYERPVYPYHSIGYAPSYWSSYLGRYVLEVVPHDHDYECVGNVGTLPSYTLGN